MFTGLLQPTLRQVGVADRLGRQIHLEDDVAACPLLTAEEATCLS